MNKTKKWSSHTQEKHQLRILDYRNGKYQGMTSATNIQPSGIGIILDQDFLFAVGSWKKSKLQGEAFIIYPDQTIFYGYLKDNLPNGICCYKLGTKMEILSFFKYQQQDLFVLDWKATKNLLFISISRSLRQKLYQKASLQQIWIEESNQKSNILKNIQIIKQYRYNNYDEKWDAVEKYFKQVIKIQMKSYKHFLKYHFNQQVSVSNLKLQLVELKDQVQINLKDTSIICKITDDSNDHFKIKMLGFFDYQLRQMDIYRKQTTLDFVQQKVKAQIITYNKHQPHRPLKCLKNLKKYYRQSLYFKNQFLNLSSMREAKNIFQIIVSNVNQYYTISYAQKLLQNPALQSDQRIQYKQMPISNSLRNSNQDYYSSKQNINRQIRLQKFSPKNLERERIHQNKQYYDQPQKYSYIKNSPKYYPKARLQENKQQVLQKNSRTQQNSSQQYKYYYQDPQKQSFISKHNNKKSYVYLLNDSSNEKIDFQDNKKQVSPTLRSKFKQESQLYKDAYSRTASLLQQPLQMEQNNFTRKKQQPLKSLVNDYELIQNKLKSQFSPTILSQYQTYLKKRKVLHQVYKNNTNQAQNTKGHSPNHQKTKSSKKYAKNEHESPSPLQKSKSKPSWK